MATSKAGLHTPITNIPISESIPETTIISPGAIGTGEEQEIDHTLGIEKLPKIITEAALANEPSFRVPDTSSLLDIGVASFGAGKHLIETVFGPDERVRIKDTSKYPWRVTASLLITAADNSQWIGTAWFISPRTLITAGHCVYIKHSDVPGRDGFVKKIQVMPGRDEGMLPFGGLTSTEFWTVQGWGEKGMENYDYGAIILPAAFPNDLGQMGYKTTTDEILLAATANIEGYPGDKKSGTLWYDNRKIGSVNADKVYYAADTAGGQSGCPVYIIEDKKRWAVAIHAYGGVSANSGTRISSPVAANLEKWKRK